MRHADRVHRRQVDDVEAEAGELRQHLGDAAEASEGAREELVPGPKACEQPVDVDLEGLRLDLRERVTGRRGEALVDGQLVSSEQHGALGKLARQVGLPSGQLAANLVLPRRDAVGPRDDGERPEAGSVDREAAAVAVAAEGGERLFGPALAARGLHPDRGAEHVVAVLEDRCAHVDAVPDDPPRRVAAAVDDGLQRLDLDASGRVGCSREWHSA